MASVSSTIWPARLRCLSYPPLGTSYPAWREGVGAESEACAVMLQGGGQGLRIHTVFQRKGCEGVPKDRETEYVPHQ